MKERNENIHKLQQKIRERVHSFELALEITKSFKEKYEDVNTDNCNAELYEGIKDFFYEVADEIEELKEPDNNEPDMIHQPEHYTGRYGIQAIDVIRNFGTPEMEAGFYWGNCIKYLLRYLDKNGVEDLKKSDKNLSWLIDFYEENPEED